MKHYTGRNTSQSFHFNTEFIAVVHVHGMRGFVDQDLEAFSSERLLPKAGLIYCQGEHISVAPVGIQAATATRIAGQLSAHPLLMHWPAIDQLLAKPNGKVKAMLNPLAATLLLN
jgi:hypothetical protein